MSVFSRDNGDTIVEVLIAIAVLGSVIVGSFAIANLSTQTIRGAQERGEALKLAQAQLELLKHYMGNGLAPMDFNTPHCIQSSDGASLPEADVRCTEGFYTKSITRAGDVYSVKVVWYRVGGGQQEQLVIPYKVQ